MKSTDCYSLSGYLSLKSVGALSFVVPNRRYWSAFNESIQKLELFQSERDLINNKTPIESISLSRSAINLSTTEERVFIILTNNKEYHLQAENHEALMIWLFGLQTKCEPYVSNKSEPTGNNLLDIDEIISACLNNEESKHTTGSNSLTRGEWLPPKSRLTEGADFSSEDEKYSNNSMIGTNNRKMSLTSNVGARMCDTCTASLCMRCRSNLTRSSSSNTDLSDQRKLETDDHLQETLLTLRCELTSLVNKESLYQITIKEKSDIISKLENQLSDIIQSQTTYNKHQTISKVFNERCRETNNELKYLHNEITKLHRIICNDDLKIRKLIKIIRPQQLQRESLQRDYIFLLQTALSTEDGRLFGGAKHRDRLKELLNECRKRDPSLPTFESLEGPGLYIDSYGFNHEKSNEHDRLQYICIKLAHFYDTRADSIDENVWRSLLKSFQNNSTVPKTFKDLVRHGIPTHLRAEFWKSFIQKKVSNIQKIKGVAYFQNLCHILPKSDIGHKFEKQIVLDLHRTMPMNIRFLNKDSEGIRHLRQVLHTFCLHNPQTGYCQGMNFIVAVALLLLEPEDAFWLLIAITECHLNDYYDASLIGAQVDQFVFIELLKDKAPDIYQHFEMNEVEIKTLTLNWFMAIFIDSVPFESLLRLWDCFLLEGSKVLFRFALAILIMNRESILRRTDTISIMKHVKDSIKHFIDIESLFKIAFNDLKPFCHRKDIAIKQAYWTKILKDKIMKRKLSIDGFAKRDDLHQNSEESSKTVDCVAVLPRNLVWIAFGTQFLMHLFEVNVKHGIMIDIEITYNSRAFCMACVNNDLVVVGTVCGTLLGYSIAERKLRWTTQLRSCFLCIVSLDKIDFTRIYCGLSDGNLVIVDLYNQQEPKEAFSIIINKSPVTSIVFSNDKLWCLHSNKMSILNEKTLDILSCIDLTFETLDTTSMLYYDSDHIWILLRSTGNILQVWNQSSCKLHASISLNHIFDQIERNSVDDDTSSIITNEIGITSFLIHQEQLWIGTSKGIIFVLGFTFQLKSIRSNNLTNNISRLTLPRSLSLTIDERTRWHLYETTRNKRRSQSNSAMILPEQKFTSPDDRYSSIVHQSKQTIDDKNVWEHSNDIDLDNSSTTLTLSRRCSSSPADEHSKIKQDKLIETSAAAILTLNLIFKAKIADAPVKCICKTICDDQILMLTCSGKLGDDEIVCRWKKVENTSQWTNDVVVELTPQTMVPIRPLYARHQYLKDHGDRLK